MRPCYWLAALGLVAAGLFTTPVVAQRNGKPTVSTEMRDFMKRLNGNEKSVNVALKKYAADGVDTFDMSSIAVSSPKIMETKTANGMTCYTIACKSGILDRVYLVCWKGGKIQKLKQLSVK